MDTVRELLESKASRTIVTTAPDASVRAATILMNEHGIGALLVMQGRRLVGMFTERDVLRRVVAEGLCPDTTTVGDVMSTDLVCCGTDATVEEVADLIRRRRIRHVPVIDALDDVVGLVSIGDVNARRFASCEVALHQIEDYVFRRA